MTKVISEKCLNCKEEDDCVNCNNSKTKKIKKNKKNNKLKKNKRRMRMEYIFLGSAILFIYLLIYCLLSINKENDLEELYNDNSKK